MTRRNLTVRAVALIGAGSAAVHELRYLIGYGPDASHALAAHPHGYLSVALPGVLTAVLITLIALVMRASRGSAPTRRPRSLLSLWLVCAIALATIFAIQETLEGAGAVAHGGWIGLALSVPVGLLVALALRGADAAEALSPLRVTIRVAALGERTLAAPAASLHGRIAALSVGARAPPPAFGV